MDSVLLTGATGHLGRALLPQLLAGGDRVLALVRAADDAALARREGALRNAHPHAGDRLVVVRGDVMAQHLGMSETDRQRVASEVNAVVHAAAAVRFDLPAPQAARANVEATQRVLALCVSLAQHGRLRRLDHVSTAYVAGQHRGRFMEEDADIGQQHRNTYEASKLQSELAVRTAMAAGLPATIHRPSIIVGAADTGATSSFNVLYWPLKVYMRGWWRTFPGNADTRVDIVPVDFVAQAMVRLRQMPSSLGCCFHLAAGDDARTVEELVAVVRKVTGGPPLRYVNQDRYRRFVRPLLYPLLALTARGRAIHRGGNAYMPYFVYNPVFDTARARAALGAQGGPPPVLDYLERIVRFAAAQDFGKSNARPSPT